MENAKKPLKSWCLRVVVDPYWFMLWAALRKYLSLAFQPILTHLMWSGTIRNHLNRWGTCGNPIFDQKNVKIGPWRAKLCKKGHNYLLENIRKLCKFFTLACKMDSRTIPNTLTPINYVCKGFWDGSWTHSPNQHEEHTWYFSINQ